MAISEFRKTKLLYVFNTFFDTDRSGKIEKKDFELAAERLAQVRGWSSTDPKAQQAAQCLLNVWEGIKSADVDNDDQVSGEEWCAMWESYTVGSSQNNWQQTYMDFMFDLNDTTGDGHLDKSEFSVVWERYGVTSADCDVAYAKISQGKSHLTRVDFKNLWNEFFSSNNPADAGNFLFGKNF